MKTSDQTDRRSLSSSLAGALVASFIVLFPANSAPAAAVIDKSVIKFADGICDLTSAGYEGTGSSDNPYLISDSAALWESSDCSLTGSPRVGAFFQLSNDIQLMGVTDAPTSSPIGFTTSGNVGRSSFSGTLDGQNFGIYDIQISSTVRTVGLFWQLDASEFRNLSFSGVVRYTGTTEAIGSGGISGQGNSVTFSNVTGNFTVSGSHATGGFVGTLSESMRIIDSTVLGAVHGRVTSTTTRDGTGGFAGFVGGNSLVTGSTSFAEVSSSAGAGGFFGSALGGMTVINSHNHGRVSSRMAGGFAGSVNAERLTISSSINYGEISGCGALGGFVGQHWLNRAGSSYISNSENRATVSAPVTCNTSRDSIGGFVGDSDTGIVVENSTNSGNISGRDKVAGMVGGDLRDLSNRLSSFTNATNVGIITGRSKVGGLMGYGKSTFFRDSNNLGQVSGQDEVGGLIGLSNISLTVSNSVNSGAVTGIDLYAGGLIGRALFNVRIQDSTNSGAISSSYAVGGLVGVGADAGSSQYAITVSNSVNTGPVSGVGDVGGLIGFSNRAYVSILDSVNRGSVFAGADGKAGGFVGNLDAAGVTLPNSLIVRSENSGPVSSSGKFVGGLVGWNNRISLNIENSQNSGAISGLSEVGGLVGVAVQQDLRISASFNVGTVSGVTNVGGLVGLVEGQAADKGRLWVTTSYNIGNLSGTNHIGGIAGGVHDFSNFYHVYAAGSLVGSTKVDGLIGSTSASVTTTSVYVANASIFLEASSTADLRFVGTYVGWDFERVWAFGECTQNLGFPLLRFAFVGTVYDTGCYTPPVTPDATQSPTVSSESVSATPEQSPQPYRGPMIFAFLQPATAGSVVIFDGIRLVGISYVGLGEIAVSYSVVSSISLSVVVPTTLTPSEYDLLVLSTEGKLTVVRALRVIDPVVSIPGPVLSDRAKALLGKTQALPKFQRSQQGISTNQANWLRDRLQGSGLSKIVCTGVIQESMTMHQKIQIRMRAMQVCLEAQRYLPNATVLHQSKLTTNRQSVGRVLVSFSN